MTRITIEAATMKNLKTQDSQREPLEGEKYFIMRSKTKSFKTLQGLD